MASRYSWINSNNSENYRVLRIDTEAQVDCSEFARMLQDLCNAYEACAKAATLLEDIRESPYASRLGGDRLYRILRDLDLVERRYPIELAAALAVGAVLGDRRPLIESVTHTPLAPDQRLFLDRASLSSSGSLDVLGIGKVVEVVGGWIINRKQRQADVAATNAGTELKRAETKAKEAEAHERSASSRKTHAEADAQEFKNFTERLDWLKTNAADLGYSPTEIKELTDTYIRQSLIPLNSHVDSGLIRDVSILRVGDDHSESQ